MSDSLIIFLVFFVLTPLFMFGVNRFSLWLIGKSVASYNEKAKNKEKLSKQELIDKLLLMGRKSQVLNVESKGDLIKISWKLADDQWHDFFQKAHFNSDYQMEIFLTNNNQARVIEIRKSLSKKYGLKTSVGISYFRGWRFSTIIYDNGHVFDQIFPPQFARAYKIDYKATTFKKPFLKVLSDSGWLIKPCSISTKLGI